MLCASCAEHQEYLLESGDGSQVICEHHLLIDEEPPTALSTCTETLSAQASTSGSTPVPTPTPPLSSIRKRKFLNADKFARIAGPKMKRKIAPIKKWCELTQGASYRVDNVHSIEVEIKGKQRPSYYVELVSEEGKLVNAWITDIIKDELSKYILNSGDVYIMPLGKVKSQKTGYEYHDFVILQDKDVSEEQ